MVLWRKQESVEKMLERYFDQCDSCFAVFEKAFATYFEQGLGEAFKSAMDETHRAESAADDVRREVEYTLYGKALLPESRGDLLGLLEAFDGLPNVAETLVFVMHSQRMVLPEPLVAGFKKLLRVNIDAYALVRRCVDALMTSPQVTLHLAKQVDQKESESDRIERDLVCQIFDMNMGTGKKLALKEIVLLMGEIANRAEKVAYRMAIVAIKRQI